MCDNCGNRSSARCGCGQSSNLGQPSPYYNCTPNIEEGHCVASTVYVFATAISNSSSFVMPGCGSRAVINFAGLRVIQVGSYLWNYNYGYLLVTGFDYMTGEVTVTNPCVAGNASPGTVIDSCNLWNVTNCPCVSPT